ncbi:MAG: terminase [Nevskia sp.]|nr:terminase [Nevskia sp.]
MATKQRKPAPKPPLKPTKPKAKKPAKATAEKKTAAEPNPVGRPSSYRAEYVEQAYKLCLLLGATDEKLAEFFGVSKPTVLAWKEEFPEFLAAIREGKDISDANVARSLYQRAIGYSHAEDDIRTVSGPAGTGSEIVITPTVKHYPPDTQAASLWLRNRQPAVWRDKVELVHSGDEENPLIVKLTAASSDLLAKIKSA